MARRTQHRPTIGSFIDFLRERITVIASSRVLLGRVKASIAIAKTKMMTPLAIAILRERDDTRTHIGDVEAVMRRGSLMLWSYTLTHVSERQRNPTCPIPKPEFSPRR
jgi:hypothetical protein